ncbi:hypothetical protein NP511_02275 [Natrinema thermotolerans]|uniref:Uncharacterized protein n=1 Tax=Natrinema thermotolerans TaxID=121872 RepID=A0AAF0PB30_9EURY|nr:zinc ribbon domain-containing protein [Natrinema thermotolerans]WPH65885.1 hypothetical protein HJTV4_gp63 [Haloarchaeal virus HJTV-4]QCC60789.1 hypothetical protein DVR14_19960 [Natrinema thermotolerans]QCC61668.1 hypothetical protein DVR14_24100 [Natrinema thermotolerans]WMT07836.1 hypothetical protein NP511_20990 [Natrinema thermotolerans]WMT08468.1 hypothetical protein NP511_02275 [Natrinema thermotolerans]
MTVGIVDCQHCGAATPLEDIVSNGDACPKCGTAINPDAPVTVPTELVEGNWDKVHGNDYEPIDGVDFGRDEISEPDRDVEAITETLSTVGPGDVVAIDIGAAEAHAEAPLYVLRHERDVAGFAHRINLVEKPREDSWTRLYITALGDPDLDPWEVVSAPYNLANNTADMRDFASNGWVVSAREAGNEPGTVPTNPDRNGGDTR